MIPERQEQVPFTAEMQRTLQERLREMEQMSAQNERLQQQLQVLTAQFDALQVQPQQAAAPPPLPDRARSPLPQPPRMPRGFFVDEPTWGSGRRRNSADPPIFMGLGDPTYQQWRLDVVMIVKSEAHTWQGAQDLVGWAHRRMGGRARAQMEPHVAVLLGEDTMDSYEDWNRYLTMADRIFLGAGSSLAAREKFFALKQGVRPYEEYYAEFLRYYTEGSIRMDDESRIMYIMKGVNPILEREARATLQLSSLASAEDKLAQLGRVAAMLEQDDNPYGRVTQARAAPATTTAVTGGGRARGGAAHWPQRTTTTVAITPAGELQGGRGRGGQSQRPHAPWVTSEERQRRYQSGLCARCGDSTHVQRDCPMAPALPPPRAAVAGYVAPPTGWVQAWVPAPITDAPQQQQQVPGHVEEVKE